jgi:hypothetical protein
MVTTITGEITNVLPIKSGVSKAGKEWHSQDYVIQDENGEKIAFNVFGVDNINKYNLTVGTRASVTMKIESKEWNGKFFTTASCTECISGNAPKQPAPQQPVQQAPVAPPRVERREEQISADSLPF